MGRGGAGTPVFLRTLTGKRVSADETRVWIELRLPWGMWAPSRGQPQGAGGVPSGASGGCHLTPCAWGL